VLVSPTNLKCITHMEWREGFLCPWHLSWIIRKRRCTWNFHYKIQPFIIKMRSTSGGEAPLTPNQGLYPWTAGGKAPDPHYRLALRARHMPPFSNSWIRQWSRMWGCRLSRIQKRVPICWPLINRIWFLITQKQRRQKQQQQHKCLNDVDASW